MQNSSQQPSPAGSPRSSSSVDVRCALTLARVALQTLADLNAEAAVAVDSALGDEIDAARADSDPDTLAVIAILSEVRTRLAGDDGRGHGDATTWYID